MKGMPMSPALQTIHTTFERLKELENDSPLINLRDVKTLLDEIICNMADCERTELVKFFRSRSRDLCGSANQREAQPYIHLIDYCMREHSWDEVGEELKAAYSGITDLDIQLEVEGLIIHRFDNDWDGGQFQIDPATTSFWDEID
jgi:hypothetical protein